MAEVLLTPTRIYVKPLLAAIRATGGSGPGRDQGAVAHHRRRALRKPAARDADERCCAHRPVGLHAASVFGWLARAGRLDDAEMLRTFNCGIGMVIVADKARADGVLAALKEAGEAPVIIGDVIAPTGEKSDAKGKGEANAVKFEGKLKL